LDQAVLAPFLSEETGWVLIIGAAVFVPITLVLALFGAPVEYDEEYFEPDEYDETGDPFLGYPRDTAPVEHRPPSHGASAGAPAPSYAEETRPIRPVGSVESTPTPKHETAPQSEPQPRAAVGEQSQIRADDATVDIQHVD